MKLYNFPDDIKYFYLTGLVFVSSALLYLFPNNFKLYVGFVFLLLFLFYLLSDNFFFSLLALYIISLQFMTPAKYYFFEIIGINEIRYEPLSEKGVIDGYGLTTSDILAFCLLLFFIKEVVQYCFVKKKRKNPLKIFSISPVRPIIYCWLVYFIISLFSSLQYSFFPAFSIVHLLQNMEMVVMFISILYLFFSEKKFSKYFFSILSGMILFQGMVGFVQLINRSLLTSANQKFVTSYVIAEEGFLAPRIKGAFLHPNQFSFIIFVWFLLIPFSKNRYKNWLYGLLFFTSLGGVVFSQTRTMWLILGIIFVLFLKEQRKFLSLQVKKILQSKLLVYLIPICLLALAVVVPRLYFSRFSIREGSGNIRARMLSEGWSVLQQLPLTGFGVSTNVYVLFDNFPQGYIQDFPYAVHMAYLQMALESGIPAMIAFFLPLFVVIVYNYRHRTADNYYLFFTRCALIIILMYYLFQPHGEKIEFPHVALALALSVIATRHRRLIRL